MFRGNNDFYETSNTRQSVEYWPKHLEGWYKKIFHRGFLHDAHGNLNSKVYTFCEDIKLNLFPYYRNRDVISILGDEDNANKICYALDTNSNDPSEAVEHFIEKNRVIFNLLAYGKCWFEIAYNDNNDFVFESINPEGVFKLTKNHIYQYIPKFIREEKNFPIFKKLNSKNIFCIKLSPVLRKKLKGVFRELASLSTNLIMPKFAHDDLMNSNKFATFDQSWYHHQGNLRLARITKETGWSCRSALSNYTTEYYTLDRRLKFNKFLIEIRNCIINDLNEGLEKINLANWNCPKLQIIEANTITYNKVTEVDNLLKNGSSSFREIFLMSRF